MLRYTGHDRPGGVIAVVRGGRTIFQRAYGMANLEDSTPNTPTTIYHVASLSKQFTAFAIALLADQGKLSLDDDVRRWLPEVPDFGATITLRHLLHDTSGLRDQWDLWAMAGG
jgi:CubicO group peptidase (beta-lactamase class C family)